MSNSCQRGSGWKGEPKVRVFAARYRAGHTLATHRHQYDQLLYASKGVTTVRTVHSTWVMPPERALWVPWGIEHEVTMNGAVSMRTVYFTPGIAARVPRQCRVIAVTPLLRELILYAVGLRRVNWRRAKYRRLIAIILDVLCDLPVEPVELPLPHDPRARAVARMLLAGRGQEASLDVLSRRAAAARRTVERYFVADTGMTLGQWRQRARLLRALQLLAEGESVTRTAQHVGYNSPSAFIAMFKRNFGTTPAAYYGPPHRDRRNTR